MVEPPFVGRYRVYPASAMQRPRTEGSTHPSRSGGAGAPLGGTMTSRQELADGGPHGSPPFRDAASRKGLRRRAVGRSSDGCQKRGPVPTRRCDGAPVGARAPLTRSAAL